MLTKNFDADTTIIKKFEFRNQIDKLSEHDINKARAVMISVNGATY